MFRNILNFKPRKAQKKHQLVSRDEFTLEIISNGRGVEKINLVHISEDPQTDSRRITPIQTFANAKAFARHYVSLVSPDPISREKLTM